MNFASRIDRAISFGVFWRSAPSTRAIIRSRNVSPGLGRDLHLDPVGEHLGAAGDRRTVAARLADDGRRLARDGRLVDRGDALDDVAVAGDQLAGADHDDVAGAQLRGRDGLLACRRRAARRATRSARVLRSASACALPRPSAIASAKFANSTVNHSPSAIAVSNAIGPPLTTSATIRIVTITETTSTTKMTGFFIRVRGIELEEAVDDRALHDRRVEQRAGAHRAVLRLEVRGLRCECVCVLIRTTCPS